MSEKIPPDVAAGLARMSAMAEDEYLGSLPEDDPTRKILEAAADWIEANISPTALADHEDACRCRVVVDSERCFLNTGHEGGHLAPNAPHKKAEAERNAERRDTSDG